MENGEHLNQQETEESGLLNINVMICERSYRLKVRPEEEESVRKAAHHISDKVKELQEQFAGKDKQDFIAMAALLIATEKQAPEHTIAAEDPEIYKEIEQLNLQIHKAMGI